VAEAGAAALPALEMHTVHLAAAAVAQTLALQQRMTAREQLPGSAGLA